MNEGLSEGTPARISTKIRCQAEERWQSTKEERVMMCKTQVFSYSWRWQLCTKKNDEREGKKKTAVRLQKQGRRRLQTAPHARLVLLRIGTPGRMTISLRTSHYLLIVANSRQRRWPNAHNPGETMVQAGGCDGSSLRLSACLETSNKERNCRYKTPGAEAHYADCSKLWVSKTLQSRTAS